MFSSGIVINKNHFVLPSLIRNILRKNTPTNDILLLK